MDWDGYKKDADMETEALRLPKKKYSVWIAAFLPITSKWKISLSKLKSGELTYLKKCSWEAKMNAKHMHSVPIIKCFPELGPTILNILTILNIPYFKYKKWIRRGCRASQQHCSGGLWELWGRKGIPVIAIPAREGEQAVGKISGTLPVLRKGFNLKSRRNSGTVH